MVSIWWYASCLWSKSSLRFQSIGSPKRFHNNRAAETHKYVLVWSELSSIEWPDLIFHFSPIQNNTSNIPSLRAECEGLIRSIIAQFAQNIARVTSQSSKENKLLVNVLLAHLWPRQQVFESLWCIKSHGIQGNLSISPRKMNLV